MDPLSIPAPDFPLIVFSDNTSGLIEFLIKVRTDGNYNHVMWAIAPNTLASQGNTYSTVGFDRYMKKENRLKFVKVTGLTESQNLLILQSIKQKLARPWYQKMYDWIGILGQAIGWRGFSTPGWDYCSEDVPRHLLYMASFLDQDSPIKKAIFAIPPHLNPGDLNDHFKKYPDIFEVYGRWEGDEVS